MIGSRQPPLSRRADAPLTVVVALDSFKGSIRSPQASRAFASGWREQRPLDDVVVAPMADGGEGTLDAIKPYLPDARTHLETVTGPIGAPVVAPWISFEEDGGMSAFIELAAICGVERLDAIDAQTGMRATTRGVGEMIAIAVGAGVERVYIALGGSSSTDGGLGILAALGARFVNASGASVTGDGVLGVNEVVDVDLTGLSALPPRGVVALTDVESPLVGSEGSAAVYGPQKGLGPEEILMADAALRRFAQVLDMSPWTGAAGGAAFALARWGARIVPGAETVADVTGLETRIAGADVVVTGEGSYDGQSTRGKAPTQVARIASRHGVGLALVAGVIPESADLDGIENSVSLTDLAGSGTRAMADAGHWLREAGHVLADRASSLATRGPRDASFAPASG
jgi:glycerate 2-kinase